MTNGSTSCTPGSCSPIFPIPAPRSSNIVRTAGAEWRAGRRGRRLPRSLHPSALAVVLAASSTCTRASCKPRGCDPNIGPRLPSLLREAGLVELGMHVVQPAGFDGEVKLIGAITLEAIADAVVGAGLATTAELACSSSTRCTSSRRPTAPWRASRGSCRHGAARRRRESPRPDGPRTQRDRAHDGGRTRRR